MYTVILESDEYGREYFRYDTLPEALEGIGRITVKAEAENDDIERIIGILLNEFDMDAEDSDDEETN